MKKVLDYKSISFIVTKECQLRCKYCYYVAKNNSEPMTFDVAKKAIDYILDHPKFFPERTAVWDFIGGEPLIEIGLIDRICDYIIEQTYIKDHNWFGRNKFSITTNGLEYNTPKVQQFINKHKDNLNIAITIDGTKKKHDINRVFPNGKGSYDYVIKCIPNWLKQFPDVGTKVTISSADIPYIKESVLHLYALGIKVIHINCVFEDVWKEQDDVLFLHQLMELADAIIDNDFYDDLYCSFFEERHLGRPVDWKIDHVNWCGSGKMLSIDGTGNLYPCNRFTQFSLREKKTRIIGNVNEGINENYLRPFLCLDKFTQSRAECLNCEVASGCSWCQGENYDAADTPTIYQRSTAICKMHKARVKANNYYWNKLYRKLELLGKREEFEKNKKDMKPITC